MSGFLNKFLEQTQALQKTVTEAIDKGREQAAPAIDDAMAKANTLKDQLAAHAADASTQAQPHIDNALGQLNTFLTMGKNALDAGVEQAHQHLDPLADQLKKTVESTTSAMGKKPEDAGPK